MAWYVRPNGCLQVCSKQGSQVCRPREVTYDQPLTNHRPISTRVSLESLWAVYPGVAGTRDVVVVVPTCSVLTD